MTSRRPSKKGPTPDARPSVFRVLAHVRPLEWAVLALTVAVTVWAWLTFVVTAPQDWDTYFVAFAIATVGGATLQVVLLVYARPRGSLRQRLALGSRGDSGIGGWVLFVAPPVLIPLALLALTPPSTPVDGFDSGMSLYAVIALMVLLTLLLTGIGAGVVFLLIVLPLGFLIAAALPRDEREVTQSPGLELTRAQLVLMALFVLLTVGFAVSMASVARGVAESTRGRMAEDFVAFITGTGEPVATVSAWFFIVAITVTIVAHNRVEARIKRRARQRPGV